MIKDLQVTLYDAFGFLLPGAVFLGGEAILYWAIFLPQTVIPIESPSLGQWVILLSLAYLTGHIAQACGNLLQKKFKSAEERTLQTGTADSLPPTILDACLAKIGKEMNPDIKSLPPKWLYRLCDEAVLRYGKTVSIGQKVVQFIGLEGGP